MSVRILATGDIHLGRRPTGLPEEKAGKFSTARIWERIVRQAIEQKVDLLLLAGDVIDRENRFFESLGPLERGLEELSKAQIPVYAVAGNHDWDMLPQVARLRKDTMFHLLGQQGRWETCVFCSAEGEQVRILGWSFPAEYVRQSPLAGLEEYLQSTQAEPDGELPTIGLVHGDFDMAQSVYGPLPKNELQRWPVNLWVVGHLHRAKTLLEDTDPGILVPGSAQGLDPTETGPHGPWLIELQGTCRRTAHVQLTHWPLAPLWYEKLVVDLGGLAPSAQKEDLIGAIREQLELRRASWLPKCFPPQEVLVRLELVGPTALYKEIETWAGDLGEYEFFDEGVRWQIEKLLNHTRPPLDLDYLAKQDHLLGRVARLVQLLEACETQQELTSEMKSLAEKLQIEQLLERALEKMEQVYNAPAYRDIDQQTYPKPTRSEALGVLREQAYRVLEALYTQQGEGEE